jgi:hypothetical protein
MRFMLIVKASAESEAGVMPEDKLIAEMTKFNEEMQKAGVLLDLSGLQPSSKGARIRFAGGKRTLVQGPFGDPQSLIAGYWIIQTKSREEAIQWAMRAPAPHKGEDAEIELRQFFELEDFGESEAVEQARKLESKLSKNK